MNKLKARLKSGKACMNGWLAIPSGFSAEVMAQCGFDSVTVDMQHGVQDYLSMVQCFQAMDKYPITPLVRIPWNEPGIIGKVLDGGAWGVICPMVNTAAEARALVSACLYPPTGKRSSGPVRAAAYGEASPYQTFANDEVLVIPMIETQEALDNLDAILDVPGISGIYVGPSDLGFSLGTEAGARPRGAGDLPDLRAAAEGHRRARPVRRHPQRHRRLCGAHGGDGVPVRDAVQRQRPDGTRGPQRDRHRPQDRRRDRQLAIGKTAPAPTGFAEAGTTETGTTGVPLAPQAGPTGEIFCSPVL